MELRRNAKDKAQDVKFVENSIHAILRYNCLGYFEFESILILLFLQLSFSIHRLSPYSVFSSFIFFPFRLYGYIDIPLDSWWKISEWECHIMCV